jgi:hypothetical protein
VGKKGAGEEVAMGMGAAALLLQQQLGHHHQSSTASSVSFGHVRCSHGPIVYEYFPVPKRRRSEAPSAGASEEEINARSKHPRAKAALSSFPLD